MLKQRIITALLIVAVLLAALHYLPTSLFQLLLATAVLIATWEWSNLAGVTSYTLRGAYVVVTAGIMAAAGYLVGLSHELDTQWLRNLLMIGSGWWALSLLWVQGYPSSSLLWGARLPRLLIGWLVMVPAWLALCYLREQPAGAWLMLMVVAVVAGADIGGYFVGRKFGKHKLAPQVSPGKTWEGFWGGLVTNILWAILLGLWLGEGRLPLLLAIIIPASLVSVLGDLVESMLKRHRGIKDSSQLLPGHGGVLDRIDSITAAAPVMALGILMTGFSLV
ncbi:phosphatidate cytidylyltransferase [Simiduia aestuariiviva]|uniref:Phosphatidate cytidylyltransferase n=1 Tax=Simiduia aestuariiviva TaxID=1510459 RepID=A0A839UJ16_9GAMM|nr:phosphatidate cytidylyltransferase [Simiduia aestuariiviva]